MTMNVNSIFLFLCGLLLLRFQKTYCFVISNQSQSNDYWTERTRLLNTENAIQIGGNLTFEKNERIANSVLMAAKYNEVDQGFNDPSKFLPAHNFLTVADKIQNSPVFKIIKDMPKGAVLHAHEFGIVSEKFVFENITYQPNLYVCESENTLLLKFFKDPNPNCNWTLVSDLRRQPDDAKLINEQISRAISMKVDNPDAKYSNTDEAWRKFQTIFKTLFPMLTYRPVFEDYVYQILQELYDDNVMYLELRSVVPNLYDLDGKIYGPVEVVGIFKTVAEKFVGNNPDFFGMKLIYAPQRKVSQEEFDKYVSIAKMLKAKYPSFVAGFDLVGQEDKGEPLLYFSDKLKALNNDMSFFFHAGETDWNGLSSDLNLIDAILLNSKRIGHGYAILKHPAVMKEVKKRHIAIEVNPISNQVLGLVKDLRNHPASVLFARNYPVVVSSDDPGLWCAKALSYDFYETFIGIMPYSADLRALKQLVINSFMYSSLKTDEKIKALKIWEEKWHSFIELLNHKSVVVQ